MQMAGPDIVLFVVGALLFGGATYAIVTSDDLGGSTSALGVFQVSYTSSLVELGQETPASLRSATATFDVTQANVSALTLTISCTGATAGGPVPFNLQVTVEGPGGITTDGTGTCASGVTIDIPVAAMPPATSVAGTTEAEANDNLALAENATAAQGAWTVTVSGSRQGTGALPVPVGDPGGTIVLAAEVWTPQFSPIQR